MKLAKLSLLFGSLAAIVTVLAVVWTANAQGTPSDTSRTFVARLNNAGANVWVAGIVDPDGWGAVGAISDDDAWNATHARWFRGRVIDGQFTGQSADGTILTARHDGTQITGNVGGMNFSATVIPGGTAGLYIGGNSQEVVAIIEAPDGSRVGRVWSRATGQHLKTLIIGAAPATRSSAPFTLLSAGSAAMQGYPATVTVQPNGSRTVQVAGDDQDTYVNYSTSWCNNSFCG